MPYRETWVKPELAFKVKVSDQFGTINVYHTYKDNKLEQRSNHFYTIFVRYCETPEVDEFDIREILCLVKKHLSHVVPNECLDIPRYGMVDVEYHKPILEHFFTINGWRDFNLEYFRAIPTEGTFLRGDNS